MRIVSVQTGEILLTVSVTKTILSYGNNFTFFRFFDMGTSAAEAEAGHTINEPVNYAVRVAIEQAVVELVREGEKNKLWTFKTDNGSTGQGVDTMEGNNATQENTVNSGESTVDNTSNSE
jgi:curli production assembly/transport component CsgG